MWQCPKCKREFMKANQSHSCRVYPIENHFKGKEEPGKSLFDKLVERIEKNVGPIKVESLPCCIHLVGSYTFAGVWIGKDRIRFDIRLDHKIESPRVIKYEKISANRHMHFFEITSPEEIDSELLEWIKEAYFLNISRN